MLKKARTLPFINILIGLLKKNFKLLVRSKSSALIVLLGPLLIIGLVGAAFNTTNFYNINIGTYSGYYNEMSLDILDGLEDKNFNVLKVNTKEDCISKIKKSELHVCAVLPDDMQIGGEVKFFVDKTRMNLVWVIIDSLSSKISTKTTELSEQLTSVVLGTLDETRSKISEKEEALKGAIISNLDVNNEIGNFSSGLKKLDLEYSTKDLGISNIKSELGSAISSAGADTGTFKDVYEAISDTENKSYSLAGKFSDARKNVDVMVTGVDDMKKSVSGSLYTMHQIASTLSSIMGKINAMEHHEAGTIAAPIKTSIEPIISEKTHLSNMFPTLVVLIIMFIGILLSSTLVVREKTSASYFRNFITPTGDGMFMFGDYLTNFVILFLQMIVVFLVSLIFFKEALYSVLFNTSIVLIVVISVFVVLGMFIGQIFNSEETNTLGAISIASIFLFFSSTVLPLETLPASIRSVANLNPFVIGEGMLKEVMLFNADLLVLLEPFVILLVYIIILGGLVFALRKVSKRFI